MEQQNQKPPKRTPYRKAMMVMRCANPDCSMPEFHAKNPRLYCTPDCAYHDRTARARFEVSREPAVLREVISEDIKRLQAKQLNRLKALQMQDEIAAAKLSDPSPSGPALTSAERRQAYEEWKSKVKAKGTVLTYPSGHGPSV